MFKARNATKTSIWNSVADHQFSFRRNWGSQSFVQRNRWAWYNSKTRGTLQKNSLYRCLGANHLGTRQLCRRLHFDKRHCDCCGRSGSLQIGRLAAENYYFYALTGNLVFLKLMQRPTTTIIPDIPELFWNSSANSVCGVWISFVWTRMGTVILDWRRPIEIISSFIIPGNFVKAAQPYAPQKQNHRAADFENFWKHCRRARPLHWHRPASWTSSEPQNRTR